MRKWPREALLDRASALVAASLLLAASTVAASQDTGTAAAPVLAFDPAELEGADPKLGALAAHRLLQVIASREPRDEAARGEHLKYLLDRLQPARLARAYAEVGKDPAGKASLEIVSAERILDALGTWITSSGPPFPQAADVISPLVGVGSDVCRGAVIRALRAVILHELKGARRRDLESIPAAPASPALRALAGRFTEAPPPPESFVRDACVVYWDTEPRELIGTLLGVLQLHASAPDGAPGARMAAWCVEELESRVSIYFPSLEAWQKWWNEVKGMALERLVADAQRRSREESLQVWRQVIRRLRETGDAERLLLSLLDTLEQSHLLEFRVGAVSALGDFAEWIADMPATRPAGQPLNGEPKDRLLARCLERLCALCERRGVPAERPEVLRAAFNAFGKHHAFLERSPALLLRVSHLVGERLQELAFDRPGRSSTELMETLRVAGVLRVGAAGSLVQAILRDGGPGADEDLELVSIALTCLGRLAEKGLSSDDVAMVLAQFRRTRAGPEKLQRELRRACVTALGSGSESATVRGELLGFFKEILGAASPAAGAARAEKELRIPAILGLGTLARQKDPGAYDALAAVILEQDQFEPQEIAAAVDSLAYVGGQPVVSSLVRCLVEAKDRGLQDHVRKKLSSLIEAGGAAVLLWVLDGLESHALAAADPAVLEHSAMLAESASVKDLLSGDRQDLTLEGRVEGLCRAALALAHAHDALGRDEDVRATLAQLGQTLGKVAAGKERLAALQALVQRSLQALELRQALRAKLTRAEPGDPAALIKEMEAVAATDPSPVGRWNGLRWCWRELSAAPPERLEKLRAAWQTHLAADSARAVWEGFPAGFRERYLLRLDAGKAAPQPR